jgi:hypothetical protein
MVIGDKLKVMKISLKEGADAAAKKSKDLIKYSNLSLSLASYEKDINELYEKIGEKIYKKYKIGDQNFQEVIRYCDEIKELEEDMEETRSKLLKIKDKKECKKCGNFIDKKAHFCDKCGHKQ